MRSALNTTGFAGLVAGLLAVVGCGNPPGPLQPPDAPTVHVQAPQGRDYAPTKEFTGRFVTKDPVVVLPQVSGMILKRNFREGKPVRGPMQVWGFGWSNPETWGDVLFEIDRTQFEADLQKAGADIAKADADAENWKAQIKFANAELTRAKESLAKGVGSQNDVDQKQANVEVAEAQVKVAKAARVAGLAAKDKAAENLRYCTVYAPTTGVTGQTRVAEKSIVTAYQTQLVEVYPTDPLYAVWDVDELTSLWYRGQIETEQIPDPRDPETPLLCRVTLKNGRTYPDGPGVPIDFIDPIIVRGTGTRTIRATFPNPDRFLSAGDSIRITVEAGRKRPVTTVPETAVFAQQQKRYVYVVGAEDKAELREVEPGPSFGGVVAIEKGLTTADRVIVDNLLRVRPGVKVEIQK